MKTLLLVLVAVFVLAATGCGKQEQAAVDAAPTAQAPVSLQMMSPSVDTCNKLAAMTADSTPVILSGFVNMWYLVNGLKVSQIGVTGNPVLVGTTTIKITVFCTLTVVDSQLTKVTMAAQPGCYPGWFGNCGE